jgi:hypothetical protein
VDQANGSASSGEAPPRELAKFVGGPGQSVDFRSLRYRRRGTAGWLVGLVERQTGQGPSWDRVGGCGRCMGQLVEVRCTCQGGAYPCNVVTCGNVWACAVCSAKIRTRRSAEVEAGSAAWVAQGGKLAMLTLTVRHREWLELGRVLEGVAGSWRKLQQRKEYRSLRSSIGGTVKALEVTLGSHGWHPHIHLLMMLNGSASAVEVEVMVAALHDGWASLAGGQLGMTPTREHGLDLRWLDVSSAAYVSKIGAEIALGGGATRHPLTLLDDVRHGEAASIASFVEYANVMFRRHSLDWSKGLRDRLGLKVEKSDEELAAEDEGGDFVRYVEGREWNRLLLSPRSDGSPSVLSLLEEVEREWLAR